jgi:hypothetical protein
MQVQDAEKVMMQELKDMTTATGKPETTCEEMLNGIRDSLSDIASSDDEQEGEDEKDDDKIQSSASSVMMMNLAG